MERFGLPAKDIEAINRIFASYPAIDRVLIYGSRAMGGYRPGSDIDLTIIDRGLAYSDRLRIETLLDDLLLPYQIDLSQKKDITNPDLLEHIDRVGKIFYQHNIGTENR